MRNAVLGCLILFGILSGGCFGIPIHARTGPWTELHPILQALPTERVEIPAGDGVTLRGIWVEKDGPPVLLLYGSGMKIESSRKIISILHHGGYGVLCCDYRGTGNSSGRRDSRTLDDDARALWSWLKVNKRRPAGVVGISIGAIAATGLLTLPDPPEAVVLERLVDPNTVILHFVGQYTILGAIAAALLARPKVDLSVRHQIERTDTATLLLLPEHDVLFPARERDRLAKRAPDNVRVV
ncbi:MAG: hypothetical protein OER88_09755, partial [Planctomycetota bacterium]|nr:hypothetical protein [Planctomycetota bacterium]